MADLRVLQDKYVKTHTEGILGGFRAEFMNRPRTMWALTQLGYKRHEAARLISEVIAQKRAATLRQLAQDLISNS